MAEFDKARIDEALFGFLESIYFFERHEAKSFSLSWDEVYLLQMIYRSPGQSVSELAQKMKIKIFTISRMLRKTEEMDLIQRISSPKDKRSYHFFITERGVKKINEIEKYNYEVIVSQLKKMTNENSEFVLSILDHLGDILKIPQT